MTDDRKDVVHASIILLVKQLEGYEHYHQFMVRLIESNVDDYIDLPMIALMGDTSGGKSSLRSNLSLVNLPIADSLMTRCPIILKMQEGGFTRHSQCEHVRS